MILTDCCKFHLHLQSLFFMGLIVPDHFLLFHAGYRPLRRDMHQIIQVVLPCKRPCMVHLHKYGIQIQVIPCDVVHHGIFCLSIGSDHRKNFVRIFNFSVSSVIVKHSPFHFPQPSFLVEERDKEEYNKNTDDQQCNKYIFVHTDSSQSSSSRRTLSGRAI